MKVVGCMENRFTAENESAEKYKEKYHSQNGWANLDPSRTLR